MGNVLLRIEVINTVNIMLFDIKSAVNDIVVLKEHPTEMRGMIKEIDCLLFNKKALIIIAVGV